MRFNRGKNIHIIVRILHQGIQEYVGIELLLSVLLLQL